MDIATNAKGAVVSTPPHHPRQSFPHLHPVECLLSSPLTPLVRRRRYPFFPITHPESLSLAEMLKSAFRHRSSQSSLVRRMDKIGNAHYIPKRPVVVNWLVEVCASFQFESSTLHLAVRHMDWYMSGRPMEQHCWQLCAITSLFIAAKCEEAGNKVPTVADLSYLCEGVYTPAALRKMEVTMLTVLGWDLVAKTPVHFLTFYLSLFRRRFNAVAKMRKAEAQAEGQGKGKAVPALSVSQDDQSETWLLDDDSDDESYRADMDMCTCEGECYCLDDMEDEDDLECDEEMLSEGFTSSDIKLDDNAETEESYELQRIANCLLDLALYDLDLMAEFKPDVIAAASLAMAVDIAEIEGVELVDICTVTCLSPLEMGPCRAILSEHFTRAQIASQAF